LTPQSCSGDGERGGDEDTRSPVDNGRKRTRERISRGERRASKTALHNPPCSGGAARRGEGRSAGGRREDDPALRRNEQRVFTTTDRRRRRRSASRADRASIDDERNVRRGPRTSDWEKKKRKKRKIARTGCRATRGFPFFSSPSSSLSAARGAGYQTEREREREREREEVHLVSEPEQGD